jgi:hypothetical protein
VLLRWKSSGVRRSRIDRSVCERDEDGKRYYFLLWPVQRDLISNLLKTVNKANAIKESTIAYLGWMIKRVHVF